VREGARYGVVNPEDTTGIEDLTEARMVVIGGDGTIFGGDDTVFVSVGYPDEVPDPNSNQPGATYTFCPHVCRVVVSAKSKLDVWTPVLPA